MTSPVTVPLADHHGLDGFNSGTPVLDDWLRRRARANQATGASRTYVALESSVHGATTVERAVGYYALASGAIIASAAGGRFRRNMPDPVPVAVLGRLAVDVSMRGNGLGRTLVRDAGRRVILAAEHIGIRGILVHALSEDARRFYLAVGFDPSPVDPMTLLITLPDLRAAIGD